MVIMYLLNTFMMDILMFYHIIIYFTHFTQALSYKKTPIYVILYTIYTYLIEYIEAF